MHRRRETYAAADVPLQWFHTTRAEETRGLARADLVLAISADDARVLREMVPGTEVLTVPSTWDSGCPAGTASTNSSLLLAISDLFRRTS